MQWPAGIPESYGGLLQALLIGLIVGIQRESAQDEQQAGLRDFLVIALTGGICGLVQSTALTITALAAIAILLTVFHAKAPARTGITTELTAVATFCICVMVAAPEPGARAQAGIAAAIVLVGFLEAKRPLNRFFSQRVTDEEFRDTLRFLAIIFIIYPLLPKENFGPYNGISLSTTWVFVILVSSISYVGYFLQKFLGTERGLFWTSVLGGLASTTASTLAFSRKVSESPEKLNTYWSATVVANAIQFPRLIVLLAVFSPPLLERSAVTLTAMTVAGLAMGALIHRWAKQEGRGEHAPAGNPFQLKVALKFGVVFAVIVFLSKVATVQLGERGLFLASAVGGTVDADSVLVSIAELAGAGTVDYQAGVTAILLAIFMNGLLKTGFAFFAGNRRFGWRMVAGFAVMFSPGAAALLML